MFVNEQSKDSMCLCENTEKMTKISTHTHTKKSKSLHHFNGMQEISDNQSQRIWAASWKMTNKDFQMYSLT